MTGDFEAVTCRKETSKSIYGTSAPVAYAITLQVSRNTGFAGEPLASKYTFTAVNPAASGPSHTSEIPSQRIRPKPCFTSQNFILRPSNSEAVHACQRP